MGESEQDRRGEEEEAAGAIAAEEVKGEGEMPQRRAPFDSDRGPGPELGTRTGYMALPAPGASKVSTKRFMVILFVLLFILIVVDFWGAVEQSETTTSHDLAKKYEENTLLRVSMEIWAVVSVVSLPLLYGQLVCAATLFYCVVFLINDLVTRTLDKMHTSTADDAWAAYLRVESVAARQARAWQTLLSSYMACVMLFIVAVIIYVLLFPGWNSYKVVAAAPWGLHMVLLLLSVRGVASVAESTPAIVMDISRRRYFSQHERFRLQRNALFNPIRFSLFGVQLDATSFISTLFAIVSTVLTATLRVLS